MKPLKNLDKTPLVPVVVIEKAEDAVPVAKALKAGGLNHIELTLRTPASLDGIAAIRKEMPEMEVGAGTILDPDVLPKLVKLGVSFGVSPGLNERVIMKAQELDFFMIPGIMTPSEVEKAMSMGCTLLKFFPAEIAGGVPMLKAMSSVYAHKGAKFIPLGGLTPENAASYFALPTVAAIGGSWLVKGDLIKAGRFDEITRLTKEALEIAAKARG